MTGDFTISAPDGVKTLSVGGINIVVNGVVAGFPLSGVTTPLGNTLTITGYNPATGLVSYSYTLNDNEVHLTANGNNSLFEDFAVSLVDSDGDSASNTLSVQIVDDVAGIPPGQEWLIAGVRYSCSLEQGDVTELTVRPIEAYDSVPLKSLPHYRRWGRKDGLDNRGPTDGAKGP